MRSEKMLKECKEYEKIFGKLVKNGIKSIRPFVICKIFKFLLSLLNSLERLLNKG